MGEKTTQEILLKAFLEAAGELRRLDSAAAEARADGLASGATVRAGAADRGGTLDGGSLEEVQNEGSGGASEQARAAATSGPEGPSAGKSARAEENPAGNNVHSAPLNSSESNGGGSTAGDVAATFFESGFGIAALVKGLMGLFGGGSPAPPPLQYYEMPSPIDFESAETAAGVAGANYDQLGRPRAITPRPEPAAPSAQAAQITVNVQAMDAQSILDHSDAIAQAVRGAMLNSSSINDVVNDL